MLENANELIQLLNEYIHSQMAPKSILDIFVQYIFPIMQALILCGGAVAGIVKYYSSKNKEIYEKILNEVYAPLYQYFVKQELLCFIDEDVRDYHESPVLEVSKRRIVTTLNGDGVKQSEHSAPILNLDRSEFLKVLDSINIGLASKELYTLLSMYKVLIYCESNYDKDINPYKRATDFKVSVENDLRMEVFTGYQKYHKKLRLQRITKNSYYKLSTDNITFKYEFPTAKSE